MGDRKVPLLTGGIHHRGDFRSRGRQQANLQRGSVWVNGDREKLTGGCRKPIGPRFAALQAVLDRPALFQDLGEDARAETQSDGQPPTGLWKGRIRQPPIHSSLIETRWAAAGQFLGRVILFTGARRRPPGALVRGSKLGGQRLGRLRLLAGRSRRAPGGAYCDAGVWAHTESLPGIASAARWAPARRPSAEGAHPQGQDSVLRRINYLRIRHCVAAPTHCRPKPPDGAAPQIPRRPSPRTHDLLTIAAPRPCASEP
jgi:hypothetical protein